MEVIKDWHLFDNIGYFVLDNASNNDIAIASISENFHSLGKNFSFISCHLCCFGHIINLIVKAFLWGKELNAFEKDLFTEEMQEMEIRNLIAWRKKGPMGKLHNICIWITRNPQRQDKFQEHILQSKLLSTGPSVPIIGSITCWGGDYDSLV